MNLKIKINMFDKMSSPIYIPPISHLCSFLGTYVSNAPDSVIDPVSYKEILAKREK